MGLISLSLTACEDNVELNEPGIDEITTCVELDDSMTCVDETTVFDGHTRITDFSGALYFDLTPSAPLPPGEYAVEISYRDWLVDRIPFTVTE